MIRSSLALSGLQVPLFAVDHECQILQWNQRLQDLTDYSLEDFRSSSSSRPAGQEEEEVEENEVSPPPCLNKHQPFRDIVDTCLRQSLLSSSSSSIAECQLVVEAKDGNIISFLAHTILHASQSDGSKVAVVFLLQQQQQQQCVDHPSSEKQQHQPVQELPFVSPAIPSNDTTRTSTKNGTNNSSRPRRRMEKMKNTDFRSHNDEADTATIQEEKAMVSMARELARLIDCANAPIFGFDSHGRVNEWNQKTAEITGYDKEEVWGKSFVESFVPVPDMQTALRRILDHALLEGKGTTNFELDLRTKSNDIRHLLVNTTARRDADRQIVGVAVVAQDVTEIVQRDRAVAVMALELRQLVDTANAPIFGTDIDGSVNEWNKCMQEITGFSKEEAFDEPLVEKFIQPSMRATVEQLLDAALRGAETGNCELEFVTKSGETRFLFVNPTTRRNPESHIVGMVGVAQDITERKQHAAELRQMQCLQAKQEAKVETERNMTAYFAHELRNPLGAIDSALSAMPDEIPDSVRSLVDGMQLCSRFMSTIMNNLLDVRKMEEGQMKLNVEALSLSRLGNRVHKMLLPSIRPGVEFAFTAQTEGRDWVLGDEHRIQQILTNVATNAIKYTLAGFVHLSIRWEDNGSVVVFECSDTGPGIPKADQENMFQRFVQRGGAPGTGLGLAIAGHLITLMNGDAQFISDPSVQPGTTCLVRLPLKLCESSEVGTQQENGEHPSKKILSEPVRFLIIDDVEMNRKMLERRLQKGVAPNCHITMAATGEEALKLCGHGTFDVVIVDQYMEQAGGVMVGTDAVYAMRRMRIDSIVIGCSGNGLKTEFIEAGADWVWEKPLPSNEEIVAQLCNLLKDLADRRQKRWSGVNRGGVE